MPVTTSSTELEQQSRTLEVFQKLLRSDSTCRLEEEYPLVFRPEFSDRLLLKEEDGKILAGLAMLEREMEVAPDRMAKLLFVGSVVTTPEERLKGHQRDLFTQLDRLAKSEGIDALVLWSSQIGFYEKIGFFLGGLQATWTCNNQQAISLPSLFSEVKITEARRCDFLPFIHSIHKKRKCVTRRSEEEMRMLLKIPQMLIAYTDQAYALVGKGEDFKDVCHEWGGRPDHALACIDRLRQQFPHLRILTPGVIHSEHESMVVNVFERAQFECRLEYLGLIKPVSNLFTRENLQPASLEFPFFIWGLDSI